MNDRILFLKVLILSKFLIFKSNLFHSINVEEKKVFMKRSCFTFIAGILLHGGSFKIYVRREWGWGGRGSQGEGGSGGRGRVLKKQTKPKRISITTVEKSDVLTGLHKKKLYFEQFLD